MFRVLQKIGFITQNGLVSCDEWDKAESVEILLLDEARKLGASAVLFRRYYRENEDKPYKSEPSVYIFEEEKIKGIDKIALHAKLWSAGKCDVYIVLSKTKIDIFNVDIYNARRPAEVVKNGLDLKNLILASGEAVKKFDDQRFSAYLFGNGTFWEQGDFYDSTKNTTFYKNKLEESNTPYHQLFRFLKGVRRKLVKEGRIDNQNAIDKLLIICILVKFLEEIKDEKGHTLSKIYEKFGIDNFAEALFQNKENGKVVELLEELGKKLNGKIFDYFTEQLQSETEQDFIKRNDKIKQELRKHDLSAIAEFLLVRLNKDTGELDFDLDSGQIKIDFEEFKWSQYSFRHLPIELISSIYEHFLQEEAKQLNEGATEKGVVYTPPFLVNFLIDEVMPLDRYDLLKNEKFKVLDPSCGSGIFLVAAYKRILQWWIIQYYNKNGTLPTQFEKAEREVFQRLLENNIFGVDINQKATLISIFSLTIAFLDKLDPIAFWENLSFKHLRQNIQTQSFFEWAVNAPKDFDLVIGNPPFNLPTEYKKKVDEHHNKFITPYQQKIGIKYIAEIPDKHLTFHFLEFARVLSPEKQTCLIIPSTPLLYSPNPKNIEYRKALLESTNVEKIFDFTHLREILFTKSQKESGNNPSGRTPVSALILRNTAPQHKNIEHIVIKRLVSVEKKLRFEIDHYDRHSVRFDWACNYAFVWKCNLLGGGRLFHLIYRLSLMQNLEEFINEKIEKDNQEIDEKLQLLIKNWADNEIKVKSQEFIKKQDKWVFQEGYISSNTSTPILELFAKENEQYYDKIESININGDMVFSVEKEQKSSFHRRSSDITLFTLPMIVFNKKIGNNHLPIAIKKEHNKKYIIFRSNFVGIHAPKEDFESLQKIYDRFQDNKETYLLWILTNSSSAMVGQETAIKKNELETLPFPDFEEEEYLVLSKKEEILRDDVLNHYKHLGKSINGDGYEALERKLDISKKEDSEILQKYGQALCEDLNEIYAKNSKSWQIGAIQQTDSYILYQIGFGVNENIKENLPDEDILKKLIIDKRSNRGAIYKRIIRSYKHINGYDSVIFIKPNNIRYWLESIALRDAGDTYTDLKKGGY